MLGKGSTEERILMWIHQHLSCIQKHTAVIMQVSLQQKLMVLVMRMVLCHFSSMAGYSSYHSLSLLLLIVFSSSKRNGVYGVKWKTTLLRCSTCWTSDFCWTRHLGLGRVIACQKDSECDYISKITGSNPCCMGKECCCKTLCLQWQCCCSSWVG